MTNKQTQYALLLGSISNLKVIDNPTEQEQILIEKLEDKLSMLYSTMEGWVIQSKRTILSYVTNDTICCFSYEPVFFETEEEATKVLHAVAEYNKGAININDYNIYYLNMKEENNNGNKF